MIFEEAYEKFRSEHVNASFMPKDMALAMWKAGQASIVEAFPSYKEYVEYVKETGDYLEDYDWIKSRLQEKLNVHHSVQKTQKCTSECTKLTDEKDKGSLG
jgi:hypothetical protein